MDFHHLKYFVEVADQKSFSKAARNLHISQSAISRTIKALEDELGVVLFMRNAKSVELTDGGTIFLTHAKRVVFMFEHLKTDFENEFRLEQGSIRIGIPPITDAPIFAQLLGEFKKVYPQIDLELYEQGSKKVEISVQEGLIDIGIICTKPNPKEFESFYLTSDPLSVIVPKTSPLAKEPEIRLDMLSDESFVLHKDDFNLHDEIIKAGYAGGRIVMAQRNNEKCCQQLSDRIRETFPHADIKILPTSGLCSFYAEDGGLLMGYEID